MCRSFLFVALAAPALASCSQSPVTDFGAEGKKVAEVISNLDDTVRSPKMIASVFAPDALPKGADSKKLQNLAYFLVGGPTVSGTTATAKIRIEKMSTGNTLGEVQWSFVKEGEAWKIKTAPLP